jgi:ribosomal protein S18 acetylase RimI-like enzyme
MQRPNDQLLFDPSMPANRSASAPFTQTVRLQVDNKPIGRSTWHHAGESAMPGVVQIVDLTILDPRHRRQGHGRRLLEAAIHQAALYSQTTPNPLRMVWLAVPHTQAIARAFLTQTGFHHVSSLKNLHPDQEMLIYVRSLD